MTPPVRTRSGRDGRRRAVILILSLWIAMVLSVLALTVAHEVGLNLRLTRYSQDRLKARALARAGVAKAVVDLRNDKLLAVADPSNLLTDTLLDVWALTEDKTDVEWGEGSYSVRVEDEERRFNLNLISRENAQAVGYLLHRTLGLDRIAADTVAYMMVDYQDADDVPVSGSSNDESAYYTDWAHREFRGEIPQDWIFQPKNDGFHNLEELLVFPGVTRDGLFGEVDEIFEDAPGRRRGRARRTAGGGEIGPLARYVTVRSGFHLNLNTVEPLVLEAMFVQVFGGGGPEIERLVGAVVDLRRDLGRAEGSRGGIVNRNQLETIGLSRVQVNALSALYPLNTISYFYTITSRGEYHGLRKTLQYRVRVNVESYQLDPQRPEHHGRRDPRAGASLASRGRGAVIDPAVRVVEIKDL